jgi:hypothetical protein
VAAFVRVRVRVRARAFVCIFNSHAAQNVERVICNLANGIKVSAARVICQDGGGPFLNIIYLYE